MIERFMSGLVIVMGLVAAGVGIVTANHRIRAAGRAHRKISTLYAAMPEGWSSWFVGGFSSLTVGTHWLRATLALTGWRLAGVFLMGLGPRLFWRV